MNVRRLLKRPDRVTIGRLAEDYDGIGQYVLVSLADSSVSAAYKARVAAGDFGGGRRIPAGTKVPVTSVHGRLEVLLGNQPGFCDLDNLNRDIGYWRSDDFNRVVASGWGTAEFEDRDYIGTSGSVTSGIASLTTTNTTARLNFEYDLRDPHLGAPAIEILVKMRVPVNGDVAVGFTNSATSLSTAGTSQCFFTLSRTGSTLIVRSKRNGSSTQTSVTWSTSYTGEWVWVRYRMSGTVVRTKIWFDGTDEPTLETIFHTSNTNFDVRNIIFQNGVVVGNRLDVDFWQLQIATFPDHPVSWGLGPAGQWLSISQAVEIFVVDADSVDEAVQVIDGKGYIRYTGHNDPVQLLKFSEGLKLPIDINWQASWPEPQQDLNWLFYIGPFFHYDWNAWLSWAGFWDESPQGMFLDITVGEQGEFTWNDYIDYDHPDTKFNTQFTPPGDYTKDKTYRWKVRVDTTGFFIKMWPTDIPEPSEWHAAHYWNGSTPPQNWFRCFYFETQDSGAAYAVDWFEICSPSLKN